MYVKRILSLTAIPPAIAISSFRNFQARGSHLTSTPSCLFPPRTCLYAYVLPPGGKSTLHLLFLMLCLGQGQGRRDKAWLDSRCVIRFGTPLAGNSGTDTKAHYPVQRWDQERN